jgi:hypothetical protein
MLTAWATAHAQANADAMARSATALVTRLPQLPFGFLPDHRMATELLVGMLARPILAPTRVPGSPPPPLWFLHPQAFWRSLKADRVGSILTPAAVLAAVDRAHTPQDVLALRTVASLLQASPAPLRRSAVRLVSLTSTDFAASSHGPSDGHASDVVTAGVSPPEGVVARVEAMLCVMGVPPPRVRVLLPGASSRAERTWDACADAPLHPAQLALLAYLDARCHDALLLHWALSGSRWAGGGAMADRVRAAAVAGERVSRVVELLNSTAAGGLLPPPAVSALLGAMMTALSHSPRG